MKRGLSTQPFYASDFLAGQLLRSNVDTAVDRVRGSINYLATLLTWDMTLHPYKHSICVIQSSSFVYDSTVRQYGINILRRFRILKTGQTSLIFSIKLWRDLLSDLRQGFAEGIINIWQTSYHKVWQSRRG